MISIAVVAMLAQTPGCGGTGVALVAAANADVEALDLPAAAAAFEKAVTGGCTTARLPALYLRGLIAAREAYRFGGSAASLEPVQHVLAQLDALPLESASEADIVRFVLRAAVAASQSERDSLSLLIEHAIDLESRLRSAGLPGAPAIPAIEAAGDLWLLVHRYEDARRAYARAAERIGLTRRVRLGLARAAVRLSEPAAACEHYRALIASWPPGRPESPETAEAQEFLRRPSCNTPRTP